VSLQEVILERELFQGAGTRSPSTGAVPILFGLRYIHNPRIVWVKVRDLPFIGTIGGQDPTIRNPRRFALLAALCHGRLDEITELWCNGKRLHWNWTGTRELLKKSIIEETNFFSEPDQLTGHCTIAQGDDSALFNAGGKLNFYYGGYLGRAESAQVMPENREVAYVGIAMAHLYVSQQSSDSFNNWTFLCKRLPDLRKPVLDPLKSPTHPDNQWGGSTREITVGTRKRFIDTRTRVRPRRYILAIDCTPINGIPVMAAEELIDFSIGLAGETSFSAPNTPIVTAAVKSGKFRYRYDVIREGAIQLLENFRKKMLGEGIGYSWNLRVVFVSAHFRGSTTLTTDINRLRFAATGSQVFNEESIIPDTSRTNVDAVLDAIISGVTNHSTLRAATEFDPDVSFWWGLPHTTRPTKNDYRQIVWSRITRQYSFSGSHLPFGINAGNDPFTDESDIYFPFFDWSFLFRWIAANAARFDGFSSGDRAKPGQEDILPQINIITGPTWPYRLEEFWTVQRDRSPRYPRYLYPNIDQCYQDALGLDGGGDATWTYGERPNPIPQIEALRTAMGANANWLIPVTGNDDDPQLIMDYRALDPFVWGRPKRYYPGVGTDTADDLTKDHAFPSYYDKLRLNIKQVNTESTRVLIPNTVVFASDIYTRTMSDPFNSADYNATDSVEGDAVNFIGEMGNHMGLALTNADYSFETIEYTAANPVHVIRECLLNKEWGRGKLISENDLDDESFTAAATQVHREKLGVGYLWDKQSTLDEVINDMLEHIDGVLYESVRRNARGEVTGDRPLLFLKLVGDPQTRTDSQGRLEHFRHPATITSGEMRGAIDWDNLKLQLNPSNITSITNLVVPREDEMVNRVVLQYTPHYSRQQVSIHRENDDRIALYGLKSKTVSYKGIIDKASAGKVADRDLIEEESGLMSFNINMLPEAAETFNPNDIVSLEWPELNIGIGFFRIIKIRYGETRSNRTTLSVIQATPGDVEARDG